MKLCALVLLVLSLDLTTASSKNEMMTDTQFLSTATDPMLRKAQQHRFLKYSDGMADGVETKYSEYAQAWRYLGLYVDCSGAEEEEERRRLDEGEGDQAEGGDEGGNEQGDEGGNGEDAEGENGQDGEAEDGEGEDEEEQDGDNEAQQEEQEAQEEDPYVNMDCKRNLLWAAYVDLDYEGEGLAYSMFNPETKKWDDSACNVLGSERCARMDCHLPNTHWKLLGFFKEEQPITWLEALAYNQATCSFDDDENEFLLSSFDWMPQGCTLSEAVTQNGNNIYYDLTPQPGGHVGIGLYSDERCSTPYHGIVSKEKATGMYNLDSAMQEWNDVLDSFRVCQPCRTYDLSYDPSASDDDNAEDGGYDPNQGQFVCIGAEGNAGVNQCATFAQNGEMSKASLRDVRLATQQGTIVRSNVVDMGMSFWQAWGFLILSIIVFIMGSVLLFSVALKRKRVSSSDEPLIKK